VPGTAVYRTRTLRDVPPVMSWQTKRIRSLHERLFVLTVRIESMPWVHDADRLTYNEIGDGFWRAIARFGFMERPDIPAVLRKAQARGCPIDPTDATYLVGHGARHRHRGYFGGHPLPNLAGHESRGPRPCPEDRFFLLVRPLMLWVRTTMPVSEWCPKLWLSIWHAILCWRP
jgi:hypothetical protein